ncbi:MAG: ABC transporter ATP-binding protein [Sphingopyxis sp.]|jgi:peptide/nickel transport system ATP-binding protein|uniref:dipeptide ABC transporter ATP-binding protein n=1 Tax=Sphingopyxis sp. TaxID=1908224 RepID=UPI001A411DA7|nr:ABC transporter ATP-binding protein [Sphingopyxis sp.]MBL9068844.1 ABC transporter ATP-binding protein [Sphingopyxis sp.]
MEGVILSVRELVIAPQLGEVALVDRVSFDVLPASVCALVGESGSGKTLTSRAVMGLLPENLAVKSGALGFCGEDLLDFGPAELRRVCGARIGMVFQEPMSSLNPALTVGTQVTEALCWHRHMSPGDARTAAVAMLDAFRVPNAATSLDRYPHEFSGGLRQRIMLAAVMLLRPKLLIADEPTTALDAIVQKDVLDDMVRVAKDMNAGVLFVTHDLGLVERYADQLVVLRRGKMEEAGPTGELLRSPASAYTRSLLAAAPSKRAPRRSTGTGQVLLAIDRLCVDYTASGGFFGARAKSFRAVDQLSFDVRRGEFVGLVGESGSGKSTTGRAIAGLVDVAGGQIIFDGTNVAGTEGPARHQARNRIQYVFQDPYSSLNPRQTIGAIVSAGLAELPRAARRAKVEQLLVDVGLEAAFADRLPHQLSGGQRQRVCIARALAVDPDLLIADEAVAALDVTVQAQVLDLLAALQRRRGFACLFISHDLAVVRSICDRVAIMKNGKLEAFDETGRVFGASGNPYVKKLVSAFPTLSQ